MGRCFHLWTETLRASNGPFGTALAYLVHHHSIMQVHSLSTHPKRSRTHRVLFLRKEGETLQFLSTSQDTRGALSEMIFTIPAGGTPPPMHLHPKQHEEVQVLAGSMDLRLNGRRMQVSAGETISIPRGVAHTFGNASQEVPLVAKVSFSPGLNIEWYFTQLACSAIRNGGSWQDVPWLEAGTIHYALRNEYRLAWWPAWMQRLFFGTLTLMAKTTGAIKNIRPLSLYAAYVR